MKKKIWIGIGAFVLAGSGVTASNLPGKAASAEASPGSGKYRLLSTASGPILAQAQGGEGGERGGKTRGAGGERGEAAKRSAGGEGGEGGEGGQGGEAGINVDAAATDPVEYSIALQVIAAHYYAGLAAYEAKQHEAGAQMFAHGLSEVYVAMEDVFKKLGVNDLGKALEAATEAATERRPLANVRAKVDDVLKALSLAEQSAPKSSSDAVAVKAKVVGDMLHRSAAQYSVVLKQPKNLEIYLDGLGFAMAAASEAPKVLPWLRGRDPKKAATVEAALKLASSAYPGIKRGSRVPNGKFLAATSAAQFAVSNP